jgi:esterase/lipase
LGRETRRRLAQVTQPILVVQGRGDETIDPASGEIIREGAASSLTEQHWMEASSHLVILDEELPQVAALTLDFMERALANGET